jgi:cephalosporin hydroxylase
MTIYSDADIIRACHELYYARKEQTWGNTRWLDAPVQKCPLDLWLYQEIIVELRPDLIIECGTGAGGSALYLASICDLLDHGRVVSIDIKEEVSRPRHPRITYLLGSSISPEVLAQVQQMADKVETILVILDSDHHCQHVLNELRIYSRFVTPGSYLIVEDTNLNGNPVAPDFGPGPKEATDLFRAENAEFVVDSACEKFMLTANPGGFLKRQIKAPHHP